jgi:uncharacterized cupredoxin-like copper-binding protein
MTSKRTHSPVTAGIAVALFGLLVAACGSASAQTTTSASRSPNASPVVAATATASAPSPLVAASADATHVHGVSPTASDVAVASTTAAPVASPTVATVTTPTAAPVATPTAAPVLTPAPTPQPQTGPVAVTLNDIAIKLDRSSAPAGSVTFSIKNGGTVIHQLVVIKTDIPQNQIPVDPTQPAMVTEPGFIMQTPLINPGGTATLTMTLGSGKYVLMCNQPAHYLIGMHIGFTIN